MRLVVGIVIILIGIARWSLQIDGSMNRAPAAAIETTWVRTVDGWERPHSWNVAEPPVPPQLHPLVLAAGQLLVSLLALAAFTPHRSESPAAVAKRK